MFDGWIEKGKKYIYPQKYNSWSKHIIDIYNDPYFSTNILIAYVAMESLEKGKSAKDVYNFIVGLDALNFSKDIVYKTILLFSKRGPEFYRVAKAPLVNTAEKYIRVIENENKRYEQELIK